MRGGLAGFPAWDDLDASASLEGGAVAFSASLDQLALVRDPQVRMPPKIPLNRETIARNVRFRADRLCAAAS